MSIPTLQGSCSINHPLAQALSFAYLEQRDIRIRGSRVPHRAMLGRSPGVGRLSPYMHMNNMIE
jgi:hypothetical protein